MGRLIDIDSLKGCAIIRPTSRETIEHIKQCWDDCLNHDDIPTAFDTEKVIAQLEEMKNNKDFQVYCYEFYKKKCMIHENAIDIVKKGGVE